MDIVEELRRDRDSGAKRLVSEYKAGLMSLARRFCVNESDAEELVNATFAKVVDNIDDYLEQSAFFAWMCQILTNIFRESVRRKSNKNEVFPGDMPDVADESSEGEVYKALDASLLRNAIESLPDEIKKVVVLHYFVDMPVRDVAKFLSIPFGTVARRLYLARQILAAKLGAAAKKPGCKALLVALALACTAALGAAVWSLAVAGEAQDRGNLAAPGEAQDRGGAATVWTGETGWAGATGATDATGATGGTGEATVSLRRGSVATFNLSTEQKQEENTTMNTTSLRKFIASAAFAAAAGAPLAATADIVVPAGETLTISSTPAEQPDVIDVHGALFVSGGAVVMPSTLRVGCAAGDDASATLYDTASRLGCGYSGGNGGFAPTFVQIGAGGGSGKLVNNGGSSDNSWQSGIGGAYVSIASDALAGNSGTIDFLELKSGYARFWSVTNESVTAARVLFTGGTWVTGQGWGPHPWAKGAFVWESANGADIRVELGNYGNTLTLGQNDGSVAVRGTGSFRIRCGWGDVSNNNGVFDIRKAISWEGTGDFIIGDNAKVRLFCADALPHGSGRGAVRLTQVNSRLVLNAGTTNRVNSLLAPSGQVTGTGALVFGEATDGSLQATFSDAAAVVKRGAGTTLSVTGATTGALASLAVEAGTVRVGAALSLKTISVSPGASLVVDGATATVSSFSGVASAVTCVNGGSLVVERSDPGDAFVEGICAPDVLAVTGGGNVVLADPAALPAAIRLDSGSLSFTALGCADTWYRFTFKSAAGDGVLTLYEIALIDAEGQWLHWNATYRDAGYALAALQPGEIHSDNSSFTWGSYWQAPSKLLDGPGGSDQGVKVVSALDAANSATWRTLTVRPPQGAGRVAGYDLCTPYWGWEAYPVVWTVQSSADGTNWRTVSDVPALQGTAAQNKWRSGGKFADGPSRFFTFTNYVTRGISTDIGSFSATLASGTSLDVSAVTNGYALSSLALDAESLAEPSITGARFSPAGKLDISAPAGSNLEGLVVPLLLVDCENVENLASWTPWCNGVKSGLVPKYDATIRGLIFSRRGTIMVFR